MTETERQQVVFVVHLSSGWDGLTCTHCGKPVPQEHVLWIGHMHYECAKAKAKEMGVRIK
jgi:hypothetical protein